MKILPNPHSVLSLSLSSVESSKFTHSLLQQTAITFLALATLALTVFATAKYYWGKRKVTILAPQQETPSQTTFQNTLNPPASTPAPIPPTPFPQTSPVPPISISLQQNPPSPQHSNPALTPSKKFLEKNKLEFEGEYKVVEYPDCSITYADGIITCPQFTFQGQLAVQRTPSKPLERTLTEEPDEVESHEEEYFNGTGVLTYPNNTQAQGSFIDGELCGEGEINFIENHANINEGGIQIHVSGQFREGELNGTGTITKYLPEGTLVKHGTFASNRLEGWGEILYPPSEDDDYLLKAVGVFHEDKLIEGQLIYTDKIISGKLKADKLEGAGSIVYQYQGKKTITIEGEFKEGLLYRMGRILYEDGTELKGFFEKDELKLGQITYPDKRKARGQFQNNLLVGIGLLEQDGVIYEGQFEDHNLHGLGRMTLRDGFVLMGNFQHGNLHGLGKVINPNTMIVEEGLFEEGSLKEARSADSLDDNSIPKCQIEKLAESFYSEQSELNDFIDFLA